MGSSLISSACLFLQNYMSINYCRPWHVALVISPVSSILPINAFAWELNTASFFQFVSQKINGSFRVDIRASKALAYLNHTDLKGRPVRIMWSQRDPFPRKIGLANLFVKNLNPSITSARLVQIFCRFGTILSCKIAEENGQSKGFGFVQFESEESAMAAITYLHDTIIE
ncbi:hypothetical protein REPUB_Repub11eG0063400 [Reevesia pubescens]